MNTTLDSGESAGMMEGSSILQPQLSVQLEHLATERMEKLDLVIGEMEAAYHVPEYEHLEFLRLRADSALQATRTAEVETKAIITGMFCPCAAFGLTANLCFSFRNLCFSFRPAGMCFVVLMRRQKF